MFYPPKKDREHDNDYCHHHWQCQSFKKIKKNPRWLMWACMSVSDVTLHWLQTAHAVLSQMRKSKANYHAGWATWLKLMGRHLGLWGLDRSLLRFRSSRKWRLKTCYPTWLIQKVVRILLHIGELQSERVWRPFWIVLVILERRLV